MRTLRAAASDHHGEAHEEEHSLEVQLPFLQSVLGEFTLLPLAVAGQLQKKWPKCWKPYGAVMRR